MSDDEVTEDEIIDLDEDLDFADDAVDFDEEELLVGEVADLEGSSMSVID